MFLSALMHNIFLADCEWADWENWSTCGRSCRAGDGSGNQTRTREKAREVANGGTECPEDATDDQSCTVECPGNEMMRFCNCMIEMSFSLVDCQWETWAAWSSCADSCSAADGNGVQERGRTQTPDTPLNGGVACVGVLEGCTVFSPLFDCDTQSCGVECPGKQN